MNNKEWKLVDYLFAFVISYEMVAYIDSMPLNNGLRQFQVKLCPVKGT